MGELWLSGGGLGWGWWWVVGGWPFAQPPSLTAWPEDLVCAWRTLYSTYVVGSGVGGVISSCLVNCYHGEFLLCPCLLSILYDAITLSKFRVVKN